MALVTGMVLAAACFAAGCTEQSACPPGSALQVVAHPDDDLLVMSPDVWRDVRSARCVRTVFVTGGDAGRALEFSTNREAGVQAAYAAMAGVANNWTISDAGLEGRSVRMATLTAAPQVSLVFLRLPDGGGDGVGFPAYGLQSLPKLWTGVIDQLQTIDGSETYTRPTLIGTITEVISDFAPAVVRTHDPDVANWDHPDHHSVGSLALAANAAYPQPHTLMTYRGYSVVDHPANVSGAELAGKREAMKAYAGYDPGIWEWEYMADRQYVIQTLEGSAASPATSGPGG
jgi:LmbE family N-acetylglucosaminyl deacetylase